ncbi:MAG: glycosyltransferase family 9 protein, partial [Pseudomonadota bacterium]
GGPPPPLAGDVPADASPLIGLQVASFPTRPYRDWPIEQFEMLARNIRKRWSRSHFLIYGSADDRTRTRWLKNQLADHATDYAGLSLRETAAIMQLTDLYVGVDTGPTHLMSTFDIPLVGLYHCLSSSHHTGPLEHPCVYVIDHPHLGKNCTERSPMAEITVDTVLAQVERALTEHPPRDPSGRLP